MNGTTPSTGASACVLSIGSFDGVHRGHAALIALARQIAGRGRVLALVFFPHPATTLRDAGGPPLLTTWEARSSLLVQAGADDVIRLEPTRELLNTPPEEFVRILAANYSPCAIVEGPDFRFGCARAGDVDDLRMLGHRFGFQTHIIDPVECALSDHLIVPVRSTVVRRLITLGRVRDASLALGRPYAIEATVCSGHRRGRTIGFPTANLLTTQLTPAEGVYAGIAHITGRPYAAAVNIGGRPTFGNGEIAIEAHIIDAPIISGPDGTATIAGCAEYGWSMRLEFLTYLRDTCRFDSVQRLQDQLSRDVDRARAVVSRTAETRVAQA